MTLTLVRKPRAPNHRWTEEERDIIRREYRQTHQSRRHIASLLGVTEFAVAGQIAVLGLAKHTLRRPWTPEEDLRLRELVPQHSPYTVARKMGRTVNAVTVRAKRLRLSLRLREGWFTKLEACDLLGVDHHWLQHVIDSGALCASYHNGTRPGKNGGSAMWHIAEKDLRDFFIRYCQEFNGRNVDLTLLVDLMVGLPPVRY